MPTLNPVANLVYSTTGADVDTVVVGRQVLMEGRRLTTLDEERILAEARTAVADLYRRTGRRDAQRLAGDLMDGPSLRAAQVHHPFPAERFLPYLTTEDVARARQGAARRSSLVVGAIEQHGPHLPTATDLILGVSMLTLAIERLDPSVQLWVLPPLAYGRSVEHEAFAGTVTLSQETLAAVIHDIASSVARSGFRRLVLFNSHGGNVSVLETVARDARRRTGLMVFPFSMFRIGLTTRRSARSRRSGGRMPANGRPR